MRGEQLAKPAFERAATSYWRTTRNKKDNVFSHETKHRINLTGTGRAVPKRYQIANGMFIRSHETLYGRLPECKLFDFGDSGTRGVAVLYPAYSARRFTSRP